MQNKGRHEVKNTKKVSSVKLSLSGPIVPSLLVVLTILGFLITLTGIYGYSDQSQHKTNELKVADIDRDVFLVGQGESETPKDWQINQTLTREIRVKNGGDHPVPATTFEPLYVRLNLLEFLEFAKLTNNYSEKRYLQDKDNQLIHFETEAAANDFLKDKKLTADLTPEKVKTQADSEGQDDNFTGFWYLKVIDTTPKGWHSDRLVLSTQMSSGTSLIPGVVNAKHHASEKHQDERHGEDDYTTHVFDNDLTALGDSQKFEAYIDLGFSDDVISLSDWVINYGAKPVKKWIVDTGNTNGWVYWGDLLPAKATTSNLLETVTLRAKPLDQSLYYAVHANLDAINQSELVQKRVWSDLPEQLRQAWLP